MSPISLTQLAEIVQGTIRIESTSVDSSELRQVTGVSLDSRTVNPGDIFFAIHGSQVNGHNYISDAQNRGAAVAIVDQKGISSTLPLLEVSDSVAALQQLAAFHRQQSEALVVGITGSVGKTTTRHVLHGVLSAAYAGWQSPQNYNNELGVPLTLLGIEKQHEFALVELAASAPREIDRLAQLARPEIGIFTPLGPAHLTGFGSVDDVIRSKAELLDAIPEHGFVVLPESVASLPEIQRRTRAKLIVVGESTRADYRVEQTSFADQLLEFSVNGTYFRMNATGPHLLTSALIAIATGQEIGLDAKTIQQGLNHFRPLPGRGEVLRIGSWQVIDETYNASPLAMQAALVSLAKMKSAGPRVAILGDMLSLGRESYAYHSEIGRQTAGTGIDFLMCLGKEAEMIARGAIQAGMCGSRIGVFKECDALAQLANMWLDPLATVLVKGSRGMQMERIIESLKTQCELKLSSWPAAIRKQAA